MCFVFKNLLQNVKKNQNLMSPQQFQLNKNVDKNKISNVICRKCAGGDLLKRVIYVAEFFSVYSENVRNILAFWGIWERVQTIDCKNTTELFCTKCHTFGHVLAVCYSNGNQSFHRPQQKSRPYFSR